MADATVQELADVLYVDPGDVLTVLRDLADPGDVTDEVIPQWLCGEVCEVLDPWPLVRRVPDRYRLADPPLDHGPLLPGT